MQMFLPLIAAAGVLATLALFASILLRRVVSTNDVHIVQSRTRTISYGKDQSAGNSYWAWPSWVPILGIKISVLPVSVFAVKLESYAAYDKGRVPFVIDITAFFRVDDSNMAAQRVSNHNDLLRQLEGILQGACRSILAKSEIEEILEERAKYGLEFTNATNDQLKAWGVVNVKNIELMDIRDSKDSSVIANIMAKKKSMIEMQSRMEVAGNMQKAQTAEIEAGREVSVRRQEAEEQVGIRTAEKEKRVGVAKQQAEQEINEQRRTTTEREMQVQQMSLVRKAEIDRQVNVVQADQLKQTAIIEAEGKKQQTITLAEADLARAKLHAEGVQVEGVAKGTAEQAILMAPINTQIQLAKEIGTNPGYQSYLVSIKQVEAGRDVGIKQAEAMAHADIKIMSNAGAPAEGLGNVMELFTPKGGLQLGAALEALKSTPAGSALLGVAGISTPKSNSNGTVPQA